MDGEIVLLNVDMSGKPAVIIGGGKVGYRKATALLAAGAKVCVVAPTVLEDVVTLERAGKLAIRYAGYQASDLEGMLLVVAATDDAGVNQQVADDADAQGKLCCVADIPEIGSCSFPALLRRGDIEIGVSTGGCCPSLAVELRELLAALITEEYGVVARRLAAEREKLLTEGNLSTYNNQILRSRARELINKLTLHKERVP